MSNEADVGNRPAEGKITPEAIKAAENMIGMQLRPEGPYLQDATEDTIRNFCNGIGDLNPLYRDLEHGRLRLRHLALRPHEPVAPAVGEEVVGEPLLRVRDGIDEHLLAAEVTQVPAHALAHLRHRLARERRHLRRA